MLNYNRPNPAFLKDVFSAIFQPKVETLTCFAGLSFGKFVKAEVVLEFGPCCSRFKVDQVFTSGCDFLDG